MPEDNEDAIFARWWIGGLTGACFVCAVALVNGKIDCHDGIISLRWFAAAIPILIPNIIFRLVPTRIPGSQLLRITCMGGAAAALVGIIYFLKTLDLAAVFIGFGAGIVATLLIGGEVLRREKLEKKFSSSSDQSSA